MEIVINISDEYAEQFYLNKCKDKFDSLATNEFGYVLRKAFENATPLPEHHGRLIDADAIEYTHAIARSLDDGHNWNELCVTENEIYDAPTIIEGSESE